MANSLSGVHIVEVIFLNLLLDPREKCMGELSWSEMSLFVEVQFFLCPPFFYIIKKETLLFMHYLRILPIISATNFARTKFVRVIPPTPGENFFLRSSVDFEEVQ